MKRPLILYDGHCLLCNKFIRRLIKKDRKDLLRVAALQDYQKLESGSAIPIRSDVDSVVLIQDGRVFYKSTAALKVLAHLSTNPWFYKVWLFVPRFIRDSVYDLVAANRYKWFGRSDTCVLPDPRDNEKYLLSAAALSTFLSSQDTPKK